MRPFHVPTAPNDLWTVDFKGWWRTKDGAKCEPLTVRDAFSRHALGGYAVELQGFERGYRVWFFHVLLGSFVPGTHETLQPAVADEPGEQVAGERSRPPSRGSSSRMIAHDRA